MKYFLLVVALMLNACDNSSTAPKIAAPQREALEKAKGVDQTLKNANDETKQKIEDAEK
jgi:ABC-type enterochelin transport system substrate-binding protein